MYKKPLENDAMIRSIPKNLYRGHVPLVVLLASALLAALVGSCGYYNPNVIPGEQQGPPVSLYLPLWHNPTDELRLENRIHNALNDWFIQSKRFILVKDQKDADYSLTGAINSINFPGRSYTATDEATALKAILKVSFKMQKKDSDFVIIERKGVVFQETFSVGSSVAETDDNKKRALETLTNDLAEQVYIRTQLSLRKYEQRYSRTPNQTAEPEK